MSKPFRNRRTKTEITVKVAAVPCREVEEAVAMKQAFVAQTLLKRGERAQ